LLVLVGPSGCGKTTVLRLIAGLEQPTTGSISIGGTVFNNRPPADRNLAMVFQRPALYPHRTVADNLGLSLELKAGGWWRRWTQTGRHDAAQRSQRITATAQLLGLEAELDRYPAQLSGGQQQRVALGRALARQPEVLLLDEPLSSLDLGLRTALRRELRLLQRQLNVTMVYVTHDPIEALALGDRVAVMHKGRLQQVDKPEVLLQSPANRFVAGFVGWPPMNFIAGQFQSQNGTLWFVGSSGRWPVPPDLSPTWSSFAGVPVTLGLRPEHTVIVDKKADSGWPMHLQQVESWGQGKVVVLNQQDLEFLVLLREDCPLSGQLDTMAARSVVMVQAQLDKAHLFDGQSGEPLLARPAG
jgi:multiple sugar transport system ATP-binding protein